MKEASYVTGAASIASGITNSKWVGNSAWWRDDFRKTVKIENGEGIRNTLNVALVTLGKLKWYLKGKLIVSVTSSRSIQNICEAWRDILMTC